MSTEYRRGIPSAAHVEAATRLGLLWHREGDELDLRFNVQNRLGRWRGYGFRPIRPDGTPVDWEVLDQEAARVGQQGQPQGFRATLFGMGRAADFLARWTVYQELKPLYDLVDGAQGEAAMPADVEIAWYRASVNERRRAVGNWILARNVSGLLIKNNRNTVNWCKDEPSLGAPLANFAAVLDAVAERRVTERGQTQAPTGTSAPPPVGTVMVQDADGTVRPARMNDTARVIGLAGIDMPAAVRAAVAAQPEPRRFSDVRPDRHGWRWWRVISWTNGDIEIQPNEWRWLGQRFETQDGRCRWRSAHAEAWFAPDTANPQMLRYTVIPTDEQGNPVSWESIGPTDTTEIRLTSAPGAPDRHGTRWPAPEGFYMPVPSTSFFSTEPPTPPHLGQFSNNLATPPLTPVPINTSAKPTQTETTPLPRFTADELDDIDHSKTTKLDEVTLRRGKMPTVEQIAKYREVRARRSDGTVADALRESRIDCEVAQYVLERWAGGLGDEEAHDLIHSTATLRVVVKGVVHIKAVDSRVVSVLSDCYSLDTSETPNPTAQRERQEAEERRQRLAELRQRLAAERAAQPQEMAKESAASRFDLIEPDPQADPTASIRAWEARQAAAKVRPVPTPPRIAKPTAAPRRPAIKVVDAEADGLSRSDIVTALFGRALNGGC